MNTTPDSGFNEPPTKGQNKPFHLGNSINGHVLAPGQQWHRQDFTQEMLPPPYRPMLLHERGECETLRDGKWREVSEYSIAVLTMDVHAHCRTTRQMPDPRHDSQKAREEYAKLSDANAALFLELEEWKAKADELVKTVVEKTHQMKLWVKRCLAAEDQIVKQQNRAQRAALREQPVTEWRLLEADQLIQAGDQYFMSDDGLNYWSECDTSIGLTPQKAALEVVRRPIRATPSEPPAPPKQPRYIPLSAGDVKPGTFFRHTSSARELWCAPSEVCYEGLLFWSKKLGRNSGEDWFVTWEQLMEYNMTTNQGLTWTPAKKLEVEG